jgi:hypothetical protein
MNWEQKLQALNNVAPVELGMRMPGNWYASHRAYIKKGGFLEGSAGNGVSPEEAVNDLWRLRTELAPEHYVVVDDMGPNRRAYRWAGFMWEPVQEAA